ncbi:MAG: metallophosphatase family protein [Corallococcus sp.]|nr:metallophosphatase family protein [Corallococcus sp.]MCM1359986.1 metallophosphatase family protein [Corallococcus sp.]MCM1395543.1 metallophosphatase family protein [Corallococcus sp.]
MKKIGVISDAHGNLPALVAALEYLDKQGCDEIIHTGDVVDIGPQSRECLELLLKNNVLCLMGNHDKDFADNNYVHKAFSHVSSEHKRYVFDSLDGYRNIVASFPLFAERTCGGKKIVFEHYCRLPVPSPNGYIFYEISSEHPTAERFDEMYSHYEVDAAFFGHKHEPCDKLGKRLYVDVGSVGCHPFSTANGIVIEYDETQFEYHRFAVPYDRKSACKKMTEGSLPDGQYLFDFYFEHKKDLKRDF